MTRLIPLVLLLAACTAQLSASVPGPSPAGLIGQGRTGAPSSPEAVAPRTTRGNAPLPGGRERATSEGTDGPDDSHAGAIRYTGTATWYCSDGRHGSPRSACTRGYDAGDLIAAIDRKDTTLRRGDRVTVRYGKRHVTVTIVDTCACADRRVIDLSIAAFERLAPWGYGVLPVTVELADAAPTLPATDAGR